MRIPEKNVYIEAKLSRIENAQKLEGQWHFIHYKQLIEHRGKKEICPRLYYIKSFHGRKKNIRITHARTIKKWKIDK